MIDEKIITVGPENLDTDDLHVVTVLGEKIKEYNGLKNDLNFIHMTANIEPGEEKVLVWYKENNTELSHYYELNKNASDAVIDSIMEQLIADEK